MGPKRTISEGVSTGFFRVHGGSKGPSFSKCPMGVSIAIGFNRSLKFTFWMRLHRAALASASTVTSGGALCEKETGQAEFVPSSVTLEFEEENTASPLLSLSSPTLLLAPTPYRRCGVSQAVGRKFSPLPCTGAKLPVCVGGELVLREQCLLLNQGETLCLFISPEPGSHGLGPNGHSGAHLPMATLAFLRN